jgi:hypothetical protein
MSRIFLSLALALVAGTLLTGCGSLLPRGSSDTPSPFSTFDQARQAAERIVPFRTRADELKALGFDPAEGRNVTLIPYPDIVARLAPYSGVPLAELDPGIRQCILAQAGCSAWLFRFERQDRRREGGFWADFLNIHRVTNITGWRFEALVVVSAGTVLFRNYGGEAHADQVRKETNPLGPLQPAGEAAGSLLLR